MASEDATTTETAKTVSRDEILSKSKLNVFLPQHKALSLGSDDFEDFIKKTLQQPKSANPPKLLVEDAPEPPPPSVETPEKPPRSRSPSKRQASVSVSPGDHAKDGEGQPFMDALAREKSPRKRARTIDQLPENQMLTDNGDVAFQSTNSSLIDLFFELTEDVDPSKLQGLLEKAWAEDSLATLKIIWNCRSIHLGKANRISFYRCLGWLAKTHPQTLLLNLQWLARPVIPKKAEKKDGNDANADADQDMVMVDEEANKMTLVNENPARWDIKHGVSHGYWKDLLNLVAFAANDQLNVEGDYKSILNPEKQTRTRKCRRWGERPTTQQPRHEKMEESYQRVLKKYGNDSFYIALHLTVARLFAEQLKEDQHLLGQPKQAELAKISLAAKWAPTSKGTHDKHTRILSTIAEAIHKQEEVCPDLSESTDGGREKYLRHAREQLRMIIISPLRKHLDVVERNITAQTFSEIKYDRVPSLAMNNYASLFAKKDSDRFTKYVDDVAAGDATISGAVMLPSTLVMQARDGQTQGRGVKGVKKVKSKVVPGVVDAQWNTLVKRIRDSGTLENSIAVCDVSGSMCSPRLADGTNPLHSSIGLSLLIAEITKPPFGGMFITFSQDPRTQKVGGPNDDRGLAAKVQDIERSIWSMNTDFVAVFERLLLPMAVENKISQKDMVKRIFVFSDMQFDQCGGGSRWSTSFERIKEQYSDAGYEMPQLVFWNLAARSSSKPVTATEEGVALVSGYSQGMLKVFLDNGQFGEEDMDNEAAMVEKEGDGEDEKMVIINQEKKALVNSIKMLEKAISHGSYQMLKIVD